MKSESYIPYGGARKVWQCKDREILLDGPAGTGKSRAVLEKAFLVALKYPESRILLVRKSRASMTESVLVTLERDVIPRGWPCKSGVRRQFRSAYAMPNGSTLVIGGLDNPDRLMSTEYDMICLFEATEATEDDWEKMLTRLRNNKVPYQQAIADCNPSYPKHWLKVRADANKMTRILSRHEDNPTVTPEYLENLANLSGHRRDRLYKGNWAAAEGMIYDRWDEAVFVGTRSPDEIKRWIIAIDEGYTNPCSMHVYGLDGDGRMYAAEEWVKEGQLESQVVEQAKKYAEQYNIETVIVDPSAKKLIAAIREAGLVVRGANNDVFGGIQTCQEALTVAGDGLPRLLVHPKCTNWIDEIGSYQWQENRSGEKQDKPVKKNDHSMDEFRYAAVYFAETGDNQFKVFAV